LAFLGLRLRGNVEVDGAACRWTVSMLSLRTLFGLRFSKYSEAGFFSGVVALLPVSFAKGDGFKHGLR
jgi:hypothetical protein